MVGMARSVIESKSRETLMCLSDMLNLRNFDLKRVKEYKWKMVEIWNFRYIHIGVTFCLFECCH